MEGCGRRTIFRLEVCDQWSSTGIFAGMSFACDIYINDLDLNVDGLVNKFAEDTKTAVILH